MKKWLKYSSLVALIVASIAAGFVAVKTSYKGEAAVILLNSGEKYTSFQDIIKRPEFKNKVVYVDVWGTTCLPCLDELKKHTPALTSRYQNREDIAFLYVCIDRHPLPEIRWKSNIQSFQPRGYHVLVEADEEPKLAKDIIGEASGGHYFPYEPYYFIVDKQGKRVGKQLANPEKGELRPSSKQLLYNKLDSLMSL